MCKAGLNLTLKSHMFTTMCAVFFFPSLCWCIAAYLGMLLPPVDLWNNSTPLLGLRDCVSYHQHMHKMTRTGTNLENKICCVNVGREDCTGYLCDLTGEWPRKCLICLPTGSMFQIQVYHCGTGSPVQPVRQWGGVWRFQRGWGRRRRRVF